jgi:diguanylate cyclase (GGDEF)-like protein
MAVFVLDKSGKPLMPCSEKRARLLLERGRARIHRILPFVIRLVDRKAGESSFQPLRVKLDPGRKITGIALVKEKKDTITVLNLFDLVYRGHQMRDKTGKITNFIVIMDDVSERKNSEEIIRKLAYYDHLTELPNRRHFKESLEQAKNWCGRHGGYVAICYIDIDRFKVINDSFGYSTGDMLLQEISRRLRNSVRDFDTVAHMGGDEFSIVIRGIAQAENAACLVERCLESMRTPITIEGTDMYVTGSAGISIYPTDSENTDELLRMTDSALYDAKGSGKNTYRFYSKILHDHAIERMAIEMALRSALANDEFHLVYQPKIDAISGGIVGLEALIRWIHPTLGFVSPDVFIPVAEESRLIASIGEWVVYKTCWQMREWIQGGWEDVSVSVNFSALQFQDKNLFSLLKEVLAIYRINPAQFEIEITESALMHSPDEAYITLEQIRKIGSNISIDDFGTGYSSLMYLKNFPVQILKIDRSFVHDITMNEKDKLITNVIINFAHSFKLKVVAEGVETLEQLEMLRGMGCDCIQGYYYSKPLQPAALLEFRKKLNQNLQTQTV